MKGNHNFKLFYYMHIVEILTNNGALTNLTFRK